MENWKQIRNYPNYDISDVGNVRSSHRGLLLKLGKGTHGSMTARLCNQDLHIKGKTYFVHRLVAEHFLPKFSDYTCVDHRNGDRKDNRVYNLRWCNQRLNLMNSAIHSNNTSGVKGVSFNNRIKKWVAFISIEAGKLHSKTFETKEEAIQYRQDMVKIHYDPSFYIENR